MGLRDQFQPSSRWSTNPAENVQTWEYAVVPVATKTGSLQDDLNRLGSCGWEMCGQAQRESKVTGRQTVLILKRPTG